MSQAELLSKIRSGRAQLESALASFSDDQWLAPNLHGGWSIKDLIAHFGFWEGRIVTLYGQLMRGEEPADDEPPLDELNAQAYAQRQAQTLDQVRREEREAYTQLLAIAVNASEDDSALPGQMASPLQSGLRTIRTDTTWNIKQITHRRANHDHIKREEIDED